MEYTFGGKYKLEEEIGFGGCGTFAIRPESFLLFLSFILSKLLLFPFFCFTWDIVWLFHMVIALRLSIHGHAHHCWKGGGHQS